MRSVSEVHPTTTDRTAEAMFVCSPDLYECADTYQNLFKNTVTSDRTLPYGYQPNIKQQSSLGL
jgi:hypothetical protein